MKKYQTFASLLLQVGGLLIASDSLAGVESDYRPDLIVSDLRREGDNLVLEIQNQGPGVARGTVTVSVHTKGMLNSKADTKIDVQLDAPQAVRATSTRQIPLAGLGITDAAEFSAMFNIVLDTTNAVNEAHEDNNDFARQLDYYRSGRKIDPPRATYTNDGPLPDLVITDIVHDGPYLTVNYRNASAGATGADFLIRVEANGQKFDGNSYYRFSIPPGNTEASTGGFTLGLIGLKHNSEAYVTATIDWEGRVRESNENNNQFSKLVKIGPDGPPARPTFSGSKPSSSTSSRPATPAFTPASSVSTNAAGPDLIVSDLHRDGDMLVLEIQNQGPGVARGTITASVHTKGMLNSKADTKIDVQFEAPQAVRATSTRRIALADLGITDAVEFSAMFHIVLDTTNGVSESRENNNEYWRQLDYYRNGRKVDPPRANYTNEGPLPDLIITDIVWDGPYLKTIYRNASTGATGADFMFLTESNGNTFRGNSYYRYTIPPGNTEQSTGGLGLGLIGIKNNSEVLVTATIDWEDRVRESNENNNQFTKRLRIGADGPPAPPKRPGSTSSISTPSASTPVPASSGNRNKDVTLYAPDDGTTLVLRDSEVGLGYFRGGSRNEYFRRALAPNEITIKNGCRIQVFVKELFERDVSPERKEHYFISEYLGTTATNDMCERFNYARRVDAQKLLELFGLTLKDVGADPHGPNMASVASYPKTPNEPVKVTIGRARLEVTVVDEPKILVRLLGIDPPRK